jgi:copper homeostasis protein
MTIVSPSAESAPLLEVAVLHPRDAVAATSGEADRLLVMADPELGGRAPEPSVISAIARETALPLRVLLRLDDELTTNDATFTRLVGLARTYHELGAASVSFGVLDYDLEIDAATCADLAAALDPMPWSFHRGFDSALEPRRAWRDVLALPRLDGVVSGGSTRGLTAGVEDLIALARTQPRIAALLIASGGLRADAVPWLIRVGVRQFAVAEEVRPDGSWTKAYVDQASVRAWRMLIDDAHQQALGVAVH